MEIVFIFWVNSVPGYMDHFYTNIQYKWFLFLETTLSRDIGTISILIFNTDGPCFFVLRTQWCALLPQEICCFHHVLPCKANCRPTLGANCLEFERPVPRTARTGPRFVCPKMVLTHPEILVRGRRQDRLRKLRMECYR